MSKICISYSRHSEVIAKVLVEDVEALGHTVWFDQDLKGGQVWWDHILDTIRSCDTFIFVLDPHSLTSTACKREYGYAAALGKSILPVMVADDVSTGLLPPALSQIHFVDYRKQDRKAAINLARAIGTIAVVPPAKPLPDPLPSPPEVPISYLGRVADQIETAPALSYEQQSALVFDLKQGLRDSEVAEDAHVLLGRLRRRRDILATIAEEIDEVLLSVKEERRDTQRMIDKDKEIGRGHKVGLGREELHVLSYEEQRIRAISVGWISGLVLGIVLMMQIRNEPNPWTAMIPPMMGGAIAGSISSMNKQGLVSIGLGIVFALY